MANKEGITTLPDFKESLLLLLYVEKYSQVDIAMMFGVSKERIRQICEKLGLEPKKIVKHRGLMAIRVWDDETNRFYPQSKAIVKADKKKSKRNKAIENKDKNIIKLREAIAEEVKSATKGDDRKFSWDKIYYLLTGKKAYKQGASLMRYLWHRLSTEQDLTDKELYKNIRIALGFNSTRKKRHAKYYT